MVNVAGVNKPVRMLTSNVNGRVRDEFLNQHNFAALHEARLAAGACLEDYNAVRPQNSLGYLTPREFAALHHVNQVSQFQAA